MTRHVAERTRADVIDPAPPALDGPAPADRPRRRRSTGRAVVLYGLLLPGGLVFASVFVYAVLSALKPADEVLASPMRWWPSHVVWSNFAKPFEHVPFGRYYLNSIVVGVAVTLLNVATCTLAGYSFSKFAYRGRSLLFLIVLATMMIPLEVIYVPLYALVYDLHWVNSFAGLIVPAGTSAFGILLMRQSIDGLPDEILDAARLDGAGELRILWSIALPLVRPAVLTATLLTFIGPWNEFLWPFLVTKDQSLQPLAVTLANYISNIAGRAANPSGAILAGAVVLAAPAVALFVVFQKRFTATELSSGVKG